MGKLTNIIFKILNYFIFTKCSYLFTIVKSKSSFSIQMTTPEYLFQSLIINSEYFREKYDVFIQY